MRRTTSVLLLPLLTVGLLSSCGTKSKGCEASTKKASALPTASGPVLPTVPGSGLPTVSGSYGSKPTFTFPSKTPPKTLVSKVLREGTGPVVSKGDLLVGDYLGQVWGGKVFDNSYDRKAAAGFAIGIGKVIPGWDDVLVGVKAGSRVLMSLPPAKGYSSKGNAQAGIKGTDTLVFVVDVVASYNTSVAGDTKAVTQKTKTPGVTVKGALGGVPTVTVTKGTEAPTKPVVTVLAKGCGAPVAAGLLVVQYSATAYDGTIAGSTWKDGSPAGVPIAASGSSTAFDELRGLPLGSRVLIRLPGSNGQPGVAVAIDLVAQPKTAAETG